jgi:prevent-host-death family protein
MLEVKVENILPVTEARDTFNQLIDKVEGSDEMFVMTKNGKPIAILVGVHHLEKLTGENHEELFGTTTSTPANNVDNGEAAKTDSTVDEPVATPTEVVPTVDVQSPMPAENVITPEIPNAPIAPMEPIVPVTPAEAPAAPSVDLASPAPSPFTYDSVTTDQTAAPAAPVVNTTIAPEVPAQDTTNTDSQTTTQNPATSDAFAMPNDPFATPDTKGSSTTAAVDSASTQNNSGTTTAV